MEWCSESRCGEKIELDEHTHVHNPREYLLYLFIRYVWDDKDGQCSVDKSTELMNWLKLINIDLNVDSWYFSTKLDVRIRTKVEITNDLQSDENVLQNIQHSNDEIVCARLTYALRKVLPILMNCNDDVNFINFSGQTLLHAFLEEYLTTDDFMDEQMKRMRQLVESLVEMGASFYVNDARGKTPLHVAAICKDMRIIQVITSLLTDVNERDKYGNTALHIVVDNCVNERGEHRDGYLNVVRTLVSRGANPNAKNEEGSAPIHLAAEKFHTDILRLFADNSADFEERTKGDELPLHFACKSAVRLSDASKMIEATDFLIGKGRVNDVVSKKGYEPLHYAAESGPVAVVQRLIAFGAAIDCRTRELQLTPLHLALKANRLDNTKMLVKAGADVNAEASDGSVPVFLAALTGGVESLRCLIDHGADLSRREEYSGFTLLHLIAYDVHREESERKFDFIVEKGSLDINDPGSCGISPLQLATLFNNVVVVKGLIEHGANVDFQSDESQLSALHIAALEKNAEIVKLLIDNGADVNCRGGLDQMTPLHFAVLETLEWNLGKYPAWVTQEMKQRCIIDKLSLSAKCCSKRSPEEVLAMLIEKGADVNAKDAAGRTPLHLTASFFHVELLKQLLAARALVNVQDNEARLPLHITLVNERVEAAYYLLVFGAEINDPDTVELVMNSRFHANVYVVEQMIKLRCVGLPIAKAYVDFVKAPEFVEFHEKCWEEVKALVDHKVADDISFYKFLHMDAKRQYFFYEKIEDCYRTKRIQLFPIYCRMIISACFESANRKSHLQSARMAWYGLIKVNLPDLCVEHIFSYLNNRTLEILASSDLKLAKIVPTERERCVFECQFGEPRP